MAGKSLTSTTAEFMKRPVFTIDPDMLTNLNSISFEYSATSMVSELCAGTGNIFTGYLKLGVEWIPVVGSSVSTVVIMVFLLDE